MFRKKPEWIRFGGGIFNLNEVAAFTTTSGQISVILKGGKVVLTSLSDIDGVWKLLKHGKAD
jgi:hypothetical protein